MPDTDNNGVAQTQEVQSRPIGALNLLDFRKRLDADIQAAGGEVAPDPFLAGAIGKTMFDLPGSEDNTVTVLLSEGNTHALPSQSLVRVKSRKGEVIKQYLGIVTAGPFAEPDSLRGDSDMLVTLSTRGGNYEPPYHGRVQVTLLGEELANGNLCSPRLRPLPNSPVFALTDEESAQVLRANGDIRLGAVVGYEKVIVGVPSDKKFVLPRHTAILGTTGGGKSTTVARFIQQAQAANMAVILLDVEGEYTHLHEPTTNSDMLAALKERGLTERGLPDGAMTLYHLVGRDTANPGHPTLKQFSLQFARLSPYTAAEILGLSDPQHQRFLQAYDIAKEVMRDLGIFPAFKNAEQERYAMEIDECERGYPRLTLTMMMDVVGACCRKAGSAKEDKGEQGSELIPQDKRFAAPDGKAALAKRIQAAGRLDSPVSWRALLGRLGRLERLKVFDSPSPTAKPLNYKDLLKPGSVSVVDLSDSGMSELTNIVISDLLRGVQEAQDEVYLDYEKAKKDAHQAVPPTRTVIIIEEAHEFLNADRIEKTRILFQQVARIAKRGRKRWLGLAFVTQLPQHLPAQVFGLVNSYVLHKITDADVVSKLRRTVSGIDGGLWNRLPGLAPGQAIVSFPHMARPLLVAIDPTPCELRLAD